MRTTHRGLGIGAIATVLVLSACTSSSSVGADGATSVPRPSGDLLVLETGSGIRVQDAATGRVTLDAPGAVASADWSKVFSTTVDGSSTLLRGMEPASGRIVSSASVPGDRSIRVVSGDGRAVALMAPPVEGVSPWEPVSRATTRIDVVDPSEATPMRRFVLNGNFEPEAFSTDASALFMISYRPPRNPSSYRVVRLELQTGRVQDVHGRSKAPPEDMSGTRLTQVASPNGAQLYTLYSEQPAAYAEGHQEIAGGEEEVAFIHALNLKDGWAYCAGLPDGFGSGNPEAKAIAASPDGSTVYAIDAEHGLLATMNRRTLKVAPATTVAIGLPESGVTSARVGSDGTVYVARGSQVASLDGSTFEIRDRWQVDGVVNGLGLGSDGSLFAATAEGVLRLDPATGDLLGMTPAPGVRGILFAGSPGAPSA